MKTLSADAQAQSLMRGIDARCLVTIEFKDGTTLRVSDQSILSAPDGNHYLGLLASLPEAEGGIDDLAKANEPREMTLALANTRSVYGYSRFSDLLFDHAIQFATVTLKWWIKGADAAGDLVDEFVGQVEEPRLITAETVEVLVSGIEMAQRDKLALYKIDAGDFTAADPSALGRVCGPAIGSVEDIPLWPVDAGARDNLRAYITSASTGPLKLSDASNFPSSGTVIVGSEEIAYTGKSGNDLTGLSRGQGGTTAVFHDRGAAVYEKKSEYVYLGPTYPMKSVSAVKVAGVALSAGEYTLNKKDSVLLPGYSVVSLKLDVPAVIQRHAHDTSAGETDWDGKPSSSAGSHACWQSPSNAFDGAKGDTSTYAYASRASCGILSPGVYAELKLSSWSLPGSGEIVSAVYKCNYSYDETNYNPGQNDAYIDGQLIAPTGLTTKSWGAPTSWSALGSKTIICKIHPDTGNGLRIYDVWLEITYVQTSQSPYAPAGADAVVQTLVTINGEGVYDSNECTGLSDGAITGTGGQLIERPDHVMEFVQRVLAGRSAAEIDSASYSASGSTYASKGWLFAGLLNREWGAGELLARLALECCSDQFWEAGVHKLLYDDPSPSVDLTITDLDLVGEVELAHTERMEIKNTIEAHFKRSYAAGLSSERQEAFLGLAKKEDASSQSSYGERPEAYELEFVRVQAHADDVSQKLLDKQKSPRWIARVPLAWTRAAALERGDIMDLNIELLSALSPRPKLKVVNIARSFQEEAWVVEAVEAA